MNPPQKPYKPKYYVNQDGKMVMYLRLPMEMVIYEVRGLANEHYFSHKILYRGQYPKE